jgi:LEA14-like dessication related protein
MGFPARHPHINWCTIGVSALPEASGCLGRRDFQEKRALTMPLIRPTLLLHVCAALLLLAGCAGLDTVDDFDEPEVELIGLEPLPSRDMEARFLVRLRIVNPNPIPLAISGMAYEIYLRESRVLSGVSNKGLKVDAFSESVAELEVAAGMLGSLALIRDLISSPPDQGIPYRLTAKLARTGASRSIRVNREGVLALSPAR